MEVRNDLCPSVLVAHMCINLDSLIVIVIVSYSAVYLVPATGTRSPRIAYRKSL